MSRRLDGREMLSLPCARYVSMISLKVLSGMSRSSRAVCRLSGSCASCTAIYTCNRCTYNHIYVQSSSDRLYAA